MRYQNWDVLIFPLIGDSKIPLQEFGTACTVNQDPGEDFQVLHSPAPAEIYIDRCRPLLKRFCSSGLLHHREGPLADCHMLYT